MRTNDNGLLIVQTKENGLPIKEDDLHSCVCPGCGNNVFDGKPILVHEDREDLKSFRCFGGLGIVTYHWIPHTCTACNGNFVAWKSEKSANKNIIASYIGIIVTIIVMAIISVIAIVSEASPLFMLNLIGVMVLIALLCEIQVETRDADEGLEYILENTEFPDKEEIEFETEIITLRHK